MSRAEKLKETDSSFVFKGAQVRVYLNFDANFYLFIRNINGRVLFFNGGGGKHAIHKIQYNFINLLRKLHILP